MTTVCAEHTPIDGPCHMMPLSHPEPLGRQTSRDAGGVSFA
jgi:hypothetical protein